MYEIGQPEINAVKRVIKRGSFFRYGGAETAGFEREWTELTGAKYVCAVTSGTAALITSLKAMGIGPGDSVLVPGYTFISTALAVTAVGASPIYTDLDDRLAICPKDIESKIDRHTAGIIPVHMMGVPCNMSAIMKLARKHKLRVVEDCCQAVGGSYKGKRLGTLGHMGAYSFNQFKNISCGEAGACVTNNKTYSERAFMAMDGSCSVWPETGAMHEAFFCGGNFRVNEINMAVLRVQVKRLDGILRKLRRNRARIQKHLELPGGFKFVKMHDEEGACGQAALLQAESVEAAIAIEKIIGTEIGVMRPINSGRHVYSHWGVVTDKVGGHHKDWDCFRHPKNKAIKTNYKKPLKKADDYLARTCAVIIPYQETRDQLDRKIGKLNKALRELG
jgi:dTDP-4-amino-4,6-dideoxygalactose transaminase